VVLASAAFISDVGIDVVVAGVVEYTYSQPPSRWLSWFATYRLKLGAPMPVGAFSFCSAPFNAKSLCGMVTTPYPQRLF
jgi:hypothetical protein